MTTYTQLQAQAKALGIKANQKAEVLVAEIAKAQVPVTTNPFEAFAKEVAEIAVKAEETYVKPVSHPNPASPKMQKFLLDMSNRHNTGKTVEDIALMSFTDVRNELQRLQALPAPPTPSQMEKIASIIAEMQSHGAQINISPEKLASLTGGREGTASKLIDFLMKKKGELNISSPATEAQIATIAEWFLCPDVPFESLSIVMQEFTTLPSGKKELAKEWTENLEINKKALMPEVSPTAWRWFTPEEFKAELTAKLTRSLASNLIDKYRAKFYTWKQTRITKDQIRHIRTLDERLASMESQAEVTFGVDQDGNIMEIATANKNTYNPRAHEPLTDHQLMQLSNPEATLLISQMKKEQAETYVSIDASPSQQNLQDKVAGFDDRTGVGRAKSENDARSNEFHRLSDLIFKLEAVAGQESEGLHELVQEVLVDGGGNYEHAKNEIKAFMHLCINHQNKERAYQTSGTLLQIAEATVIGTAIAEEVGAEIQAQYSEAV